MWSGALAGIPEPIPEIPRTFYLTSPRCCASTRSAATESASSTVAVRSINFVVPAVSMRWTFSSLRVLSVAVTWRGNAYSGMRHASESGGLLEDKIVRRLLRESGRFHGHLSAA